MDKSRVTLTEECMAIYNDILESKSLRYAVFSIKDEERIFVEHTGDLNGPRSTYADFVDRLTVGENRKSKYGLFMYTFQPEGAGTLVMSRLLFIFWQPDEVTWDERMLYQSTYNKLKDAFPGVDVAIPVSYADDLEVGEVEEKILEKE